jgi:hypothetical protein
MVPGIGAVLPPSGPTPDDLVAGDVEGLHDRLSLPHGELASKPRAPLLSP